ncbi:MAG: dual specificity protein phosphatase family protein [Bacteroidetes bacterium]|nr:dual specificity protein phosphatase family protein [Bacteroidota bacterium]
MSFIKSEIFYYIILVLLVRPGFSQNPATPRPEIWAKKVTNWSFDNLYQLNNDVYRSEQPDNSGFRVIAQMGIKSILNLRVSNSDSTIIGDLNLNYFHVPMRAKHFTENEVTEALRIIQKAPKPILIHCVYGSDRTGLVCAMYRIVFQDWSYQEAIDEMINGGYGFHEKYSNIPLFIEQRDSELIKKKFNDM